MTKTLHALVQARMGSSRLQGKSLKQFADFSLIELVHLYLVNTPCISEITYCLPSSSDNDILESHISTLGARIHRGSETDVLDRFSTATHLSNFLLRVTATTLLNVLSIFQNYLNSFVQVLIIATILLIIVFL